jgi:hypothetical protein
MFIKNVPDQLLRDLQQLDVLYLDKHHIEQLKIPQSIKMKATRLQLGNNSIFEFPILQGAKALVCRTERKKRKVQGRPRVKLT